MFETTQFSPEDVAGTRNTRPSGWRIIAEIREAVLEAGGDEFRREWSSVGLDETAAMVRAYIAGVGQERARRDPVNRGPDKRCGGRCGELLPATNFHKGHDVCRRCESAWFRYLDVQRRRGSQLARLHFTVTEADTVGVCRACPWPILPGDEVKAEAELAHVECPEEGRR